MAGIAQWLPVGNVSAAKFKKIQKIATVIFLKKFVRYSADGVTGGRQGQIITRFECN